MQIGLQPGGSNFGRGYVENGAILRVGPTEGCVICGYAVAIGHVNKRDSPARVLAGNLDGEFLLTKADRTLFDTSREPSNGRCAAESIGKRDKNLLRRWHVCRSRLLLPFVARMFEWGLSSYLCNEGRCQRLRRTPVACEAGNFASPVKVHSVDGLHHLHHFSSHQLLLLIVSIKRAFHMTETAFHSERVGNELHCRDDLIGRNTLQLLDILIDCFRWFRRRDLELGWRDLQT